LSLNWEEKRFQELGDLSSLERQPPIVIGKAAQALLDIAFQFGGILNVKQTG
jgi:hypothetical protein